MGFLPRRESPHYVGGLSLPDKKHALNRTHDIGTLPTKPAHAERSPEGKVEACGRLVLAPFDFAPLRSGRAVSVSVRAERNPQGEVEA